VKSFLTSKLTKYIQSIVIDEKLSEIAIITSANISKLVDNLSGNFSSLNVYNKINDFCGTAEIYFIFPDIKFTFEEIGLIKNALSQKLIIFSSEKNVNEDLLKLGLVKEFSEKDLCCHSYNLKTYNIKRDWNNSKGWANPENFKKYRW
tara:strand:+ start:264 stop:707 length:444 start_codon:yes stop_codon:yes gene_type:complete